MSFKDIIRINKTEKIKDEEQAKLHKQESITADTLEIALNTQIQAVADFDLEDTPRATVLSMLVTKKLEEHFTFKVLSGQAENYIQAMRQVLSRTRAKARKQKRKLDEFKLFVIEVKQLPGYDEITLMRTRAMPENLASVYNDLIDAFERK